MDSIKIGRNAEVLKERALFLRDKSLLVVADLHLGYESVLQHEGVSIPRKQKAVMLEMFEKALDKYSPDKILVNGDLKHNFSRNLDEEWLEVKDVLRILSEKAKLIVIRGNHDNFLASILGDMGVELRKSYRAGGFTFTHGHLDVKTTEPVVIGHEHPALKLRDSVGAQVSLPAFVVGSNIIVLPAMSPLALGVDVSSAPYLSPILNSRDIRNARVIGVDDRDGVLDFGVVGKLKGLDVSLALK